MARQEGSPRECNRREISRAKDMTKGDPTSEILEKFNRVLPDSEVFGTSEEVLKSRYPIVKKFCKSMVGENIIVYCDESVLQRDIQHLYCNYHGRLRAVEKRVCQCHLENFDPYCWEKCETEWSIKKLRPVLIRAYREHLGAHKGNLRETGIDASSSNPAHAEGVRRCARVSPNKASEQTQFSLLDR